MFEQNSYQAYVDASLVGLSPVRLVTALYKGAIDACVKAEQCFATQDIMGRSRAVTKVVNILTELMISLNHEKGGELSANLKRLYSYMQQRVLAAHTGRQIEPIREVERLLGQMLDAWEKVVESQGESARDFDEGQLITEDTPSYSETNTSYGSYFDSGHDSLLGRSFSF